MNMKILKVMAVAALVSCGASAFEPLTEEQRRLVAFVPLTEEQQRLVDEQRLVDNEIREKALSLLENAEVQESLVFTHTSDAATREAAHEKFQDYVEVLRPLLPSTYKWSKPKEEYDTISYLENAVAQEGLIFTQTNNPATRASAHGAFKAYVLLLKDIIRRCRPTKKCYIEKDNSISSSNFSSF
jgi:hypothetical protein